jgi:hypothetical protein
MSALTRRFSRLRRFHRLYRGEHGSASSFAVIVVAVLMLVAGLCIEGGRVLNARATMADQAEQAARAGAQELALEGVRSGNAVALNESTAATAARSYLAAVDASDGSSVDVNDQTVAVTVQRDVPTSLLHLVGVPSVHVEVTGEARTAVGIYKDGDL